MVTGKLIIIISYGKLIDSRNMIIDYIIIQVLYTPKNIFTVKYFFEFINYNAFEHILYRSYS